MKMISYGESTEVCKVLCQLSEELLMGQMKEWLAKSYPSESLVFTDTANQSMFTRGKDGARNKISFGLKMIQDAQSITQVASCEASQEIAHHEYFNGFNTYPNILAQCCIRLVATFLEHITRPVATEESPSDRTIKLMTKMHSNPIAMRLSYAIQSELERQNIPATFSNGATSIENDRFEFVAKIIQGDEIAFEDLAGQALQTAVVTKVRKKRFNIEVIGTGEVRDIDKYMAMPYAAAM